MKLIGMKTEVEDAKRALAQRQAVLFYGPTGNGKTLAAWKVAEALSKKLGVPVVYLQLYPEMTKNTLLGGETIKKGSIVVGVQPILSLGVKGAIFIVDECTHTTEPVLLAFNSLIEEPYSTVVGETEYKLSPKTRFIFCGNLPDHAGNIHLPISFANRLYIINTGLPDEKTLCKIGREASKEAPDEFLELVANIISKTHEASFPISPRNMVAAARGITSVLDTGFNEGSLVQGTLRAACLKYNVDADALKRVIMSSMMAHVKTHSSGPDKVASLLW